MEHAAATLPANPVARDKSASPVLRRLTNWFLPVGAVQSRANRGMTRVFVQTHFLAAVAGLATIVYLLNVPQGVQPAFYVILVASMVFAVLPFILRQTGNMAMISLLSFQAMTVASLAGTYDYGGLSSPFLPWLLVSLMSGLFYQSSRIRLVLGQFAAAVALFFVAVLVLPRVGGSVAHPQLQLLSWVSIGVAMLYMAVMALYYARITASRAELALEAERYHSASVELEQARAVAERMSRDRSQFFAKMSHELRTPLNAVINYSEMLLEDCEDDPQSSGQRMADLTRINATGKHLLSLVSGVFDMEDLDARGASTDVRSFDLGQLCDVVVATAEPLMARNGNRLVVDCPIRSDVMHTDEQKLRQMLLNLLSNAAKFTTNGTVTLELWIERGLADDRIHAAVSDTGIGIAPDVLPHLFETYMQADATIYDRFGGTGIGLALTRKFALLLGGDVSVTSRVGAGSTFTVDVPAELKRPAVSSATQTVLSSRAA